MLPIMYHSEHVMPTIGAHAALGASDKWCHEFEPLPLHFQLEVRVLSVFRQCPKVSQNKYQIRHDDATCPRMTSEMQVGESASPLGDNLSH